MYNTFRKKFLLNKFKIYLVILLLETLDTVKIKRCIKYQIKMSYKNNYIKENLYGK